MLLSPLILAAVTFGRVRVGAQFMVGVDCIVVFRLTTPQLVCNFGAGSTFLSSGIQGVGRAFRAGRPSARLPSQRLAHKRTRHG